MSRAKELSALLDKLYQRKQFGVKPGLDNTVRLFKRLGLAPDALPVVHLAGTNGKGSTAAMVEAVLRRSGYSTGLFTSPHLVRFNERFKINGVDVDDERLLRAVDAIVDILEEDDAATPESPITFFECSTALAMMMFTRAEVDIAVIETGLGGRLDATTVLDPILSVITRIDFDHMQWLGETLPEIAWEKAGILKERIPVVISQQHDDARQVLRAKAKAIRAPVFETDSVQLIEQEQGARVEVLVSTPVDDYGKIRLSLSGRFQYENLATAITAVEVLHQSGWHRISRDSIKKGLASTVWPGRMEVGRTSPLTLLDGAHNLSGMKAFMDTLECYREPGQELGVVFGCSADKDMEGMIRRICDTADRLWLVEFDDLRSTSQGVLDEAVNTLNIHIPCETSTLLTADEDARAWADERGALLAVGGSLFLVGEWKRRYT